MENLEILPGSEKNVISFLTMIGRLKQVKRTGWVLSGVKQPESVAGHMYRMAAMTLLLQEQSQLNKSRCMELAIVHDMAECIVGDITPHCGVTVEEKHRRENEAMQDLARLIGPTGSYLLQLYQEYEDQATKEAQFVKDLDRFDMVLQAFEYEQANSSLNLQEFFDSTEGKFKSPFVKNLVVELEKERNTYLLNK